MLRVLTSLLSGRSRAATFPGAQIAEEPNEMRLAPMHPLTPPPADNDDVLADLHGEVERDLRSAGYLR